MRVVPDLDLCREGAGAVRSPAVTRLYTGKGDDGTTGLLFGGRVPKDSPHPRATGAVDEAQAVIGVARSLADRGGEFFQTLGGAVSTTPAIDRKTRTDFFVVGHPAPALYGAIRRRQRGQDTQDMGRQQRPRAAQASGTCGPRKDRCLQPRWESHSQRKL